MPTRAILFDFGHTLVDYVPAEPFLLETYQAIRQQLAEELSAEIPSAEALVKAISNRIGEAIGQSYQRNEIEELDLVALYRDAFAALDLPLPEERLQEFLRLEHRALAQATSLPPPNEDLLYRLHDRGYRLGIVSNMTLLPDLMRLDPPLRDIAGLFDAQAFSSVVGVRKPDPRIYRAALEQIGVPPEEILYVGDRLLEDIRGPKSHGMRALLTREFRQEDDPNAEADGHLAKLSEIWNFL
jgi:putative hydrolase of the HAD superfamily